MPVKASDKLVSVNCDNGKFKFLLRLWNDAWPSSPWLGVFLELLKSSLDDLELLLLDYDMSESIFSFTIYFENYDGIFESTPSISLNFIYPRK